MKVMFFFLLSSKDGGVGGGLTRKAHTSGLSGEV